MENVYTYFQGLDPTLLLVVLGFIVFLIVKGLDFLRFLPTGMLKRVGVLVGSVVSTSMIGEAERALSTAVVMLLSVFFNEAVNWTSKKLVERNQ